MTQKTYPIIISNYKNILFTSLICLILGHLVIKAFFPSIVINALGFIILFAIVWSKSLSKNDFFGFVMIIYVLSYFRYAEAQGGAFNFLAFFLIVFYKISSKNYKTIKVKDTIINLMLLILIISNIVGWLIKNEMPLFVRFEGIICFFAYLMMFDIARKIEFTPDRIKTFLEVSIIILSYSFLMSLNKFFMIYMTDLPIFGDTLNFGSDNIGGVVGYSPISGEIGLLMLIFIIPFYLCKISFTNFISKKFLMFGIAIMILTIIIANSRSVIILATLAILLYSLISNLNLINSIRNIKLLTFSLIIIIALIYYIAPQLNLQQVKGRFDEIIVDDIGAGSLITGEGINRTIAFELGARMLSRENWFIGYGWGTMRSNRIAWFGDEDFYRMCPHSLFLSLPMLFGWSGTIAFYLLILITMHRLYRIIIKNRKTSDFIILPSLGFFLMFLFFLINEIKATVLVQPNYFMIFWILLGLANSVVNTYKFKINRNQSATNLT